MFIFLKHNIFSLSLFLLLMTCSLNIWADPPNCPCYDPDIENYEECLALFPDCDSDIIPIDNNITWLLAMGTLFGLYLAYKEDLKIRRIQFVNKNKNLIWLRNDKRKTSYKNKL